MDINGYIKILIFKHNCVIIPGFGGIVMQYAPATIHPTQHIFQPPRKALAFNKALTTNDGLLISQVANGEEISYDEAEQAVRSYVQMMETSINQKGDFFIHDVGKLMKDVEGNVQFKTDETVNFLLNSFGLDHFISSPIIRRDSYEPQIQTNTLTPKKKKRFGWFGLISIALVLAYLVIQALAVNDILPFSSGPAVAGISFDSFKHSISTEAIRNNGASLPVATHHKDTVVQIIVIRDETKQGAASGNQPTTTKTDTAKSIATPVASSPNTTTTYISPETGYHVSNLGNYILIFYSTSDSLKATGVESQLLNNKIPVKMIHPSTRRFVICKTGYLTAVAVVKDLSVYKLMGYDNVSIESIDAK